MKTRKEVQTSFLNFGICKAKTVFSLLSQKSLFLFIIYHPRTTKFYTLHFCMTNTVELQHARFFGPENIQLPPLWRLESKNLPEQEPSKLAINRSFIAHTGVSQPTNGLNLLTTKQHNNFFQNAHSYRQAGRSHPRRMRRTQARNGMVPRRPIAQGQMPVGRFVPCDRTLVPGWWYVSILCGIMLPLLAIAWLVCSRCAIDRPHETGTPCVFLPLSNFAQLPAAIAFAMADFIGILQILSAHHTYAPPIADTCPALLSPRTTQ